jgi:hypothetical protein
MRAHKQLASSLGVRCLSILSLSILCVVAAHAQINESTSLNELEFSQLSQRDPNPLDEKALSNHPEQWEHVETEHFIYHFVHRHVVTPMSVEAEFHSRIYAGKFVTFAVLEEKFTITARKILAAPCHKRAAISVREAPALEQMLSLRTDGAKQERWPRRGQKVLCRLQFTRSSARMRLK